MFDGKPLEERALIGGEVSLLGKAVIVAVHVPIPVDQDQRLLRREQKIPAQRLFQGIQGVAEIFQSRRLIPVFPQQRNQLLSGGAALHHHIVEQRVRPLERERDRNTVQSNARRLEHCYLQQGNPPSSVFLSILVYPRKLPAATADFLPSPDYLSCSQKSTIISKKRRSPPEAACRKGEQPHGERNMDRVRPKFQ